MAIHPNHLGHRAAFILLFRIFELSIFLHDIRLELLSVGLSPLKLVDDRLQVWPNFGKLLYFYLNFLDDQIVGWLLLKLECENVL